MKRVLSLLLTIFVCAGVCLGAVAASGKGRLKQSRADRFRDTAHEIVRQAIQNDSAVRIDGTECNSYDLIDWSIALSAAPDRLIRFNHLTEDKLGVLGCLFLKKADIDEAARNPDFEFYFRTDGKRAESIAALMNRYYPGHSITAVSLGNFSFKKAVHAAAKIDAVSRTNIDNMYYYYYDIENNQYIYGGRCALDRNGYVHFKTNGMPVFFSQGMLPGAK